MSPSHNQLKRFFVFPKCCFGTYIIDMPPSGSQWCSNLGIYINDLARVKRQWLLCILWSATECKLMTLDDITTQIERHYELTTNTTHSLRRLTQYFTAHSGVGQLKMKLADDNPIKDSLSLLKMQPPNTLAFFGSKDDEDRINIYFQVEHFLSLVHILIHGLFRRLCNAR